MVNLSEAQVMELTSNPAWKELIERVKQWRRNNDEVYMESPDPFTHGMGVGSRKTCDLVLALPEILRKEITGESTGYKSLRANVIPIKK